MRTTHEVNGCTAGKWTVLRNPLFILSGPPRTISIIPLLLALTICGTTWAQSQSKDYIYVNGRLLAIEVVAGTPAAPSNLTATASSSALRIDLAWTDNSTNESGFKVERKVGAAGAFSEIATVGASVTTYADPALSASTTYYYRVRAYNAAGDSPYSNEAGATTVSLPTAPSSLTATAASLSQINLAWTDNSTNESGFKVERKTGAGGTYAQVATLSANVVTYSDPGLSASTTYYYRVKAYNSSGDSTYSNQASASTSPPAVPTSLAATAVSASQINLSWTDTSSDETGFKLERKTGAGGIYAQIATLGANVTSYSDTGLLSATTYYYRVRTYNSVGNSPYSNEASAATADTVAPGAPTNLVATASSTTQVSLTWTASTDNVGVSHYQIERSFNNAAYTQIATSAVTSYSDTSAGAGITYLYRVRAVDTSNNLSGYSNTELATTILSTDDPLTATVTLVKSQHFSELRQAVNAVRASAGLSAATWTDSSLAGVTIKALHVQELRTNLDQARTALGFSAPSYTDPTLTAGVTVVKKVHGEELRQNVK